MPPQLDRSDLRLVQAIAQAGRLSAAGQALGLAPSVVTKRLAALEARLGAALFERSTRQLALTTDGRLLLAQAHSLLAQFDALEADLLERRRQVVGPVQIAATFGFGRTWVAPVLARLQADHPGLRVHLHLCDHLSDLTRAGLDAAVWLWPVPPEHAHHWTASRLASNQRVVVGAPAYLRRHGLPLQPADLLAHRCLLALENTPPTDPGRTPQAARQTWVLQRSQGPQRLVERIEASGPLTSNSGETVRDWCLAGHGLMLRSQWDVAPLVRQGALQTVLPGWAMTDADVQWLQPRQSRSPRRLRVVRDALAQAFVAAPWGGIDDSPTRPGERS